MQPAVPNPLGTPPAPTLDPQAPDAKSLMLPLIMGLGLGAIVHHIRGNRGALGPSNEQGVRTATDEGNPMILPTAAILQNLIAQKQARQQAVMKEHDSLVKLAQAAVQKGTWTPSQAIEFIKGQPIDEKLSKLSPLEEALIRQRDAAANLSKTRENAIITSQPGKEKLNQARIDELNARAKKDLRAPTGSSAGQMTPKAWMSVAMAGGLPAILAADPKDLPAGARALATKNYFAKLDKGRVNQGPAAVGRLGQAGNAAIGMSMVNSMARGDTTGNADLFKGLKSVVTSNLQQATQKPTELSPSVQWARSKIEDPVAFGQIQSMGPEKLIAQLNGEHPGQPLTDQDKEVISIYFPGYTGQ